MSAPTRLAVFALGLASIFAAATTVGRAVEPVHDNVAEPMGEAHDGDMTSEGATPRVDGGEHRGDAGGEGHGGASVGGLAVADDQLRLQVDNPVLSAVEAHSLTFRILSQDGAVVTDLDPEQGGVALHLVVVGRDLTGFQHLHPEMAPDGTWSVPLRLASPGAHRAFVDVTVADEPHTLGVDLFAPGDVVLQPLPDPAAVTSVDGYEVRLDEPELAAGQAAELSFSVARDGASVADLEDYLGARGHLVGLRQGDLAYLHLHPEEAAAEDTIVFAGSFPSPGTYRLFLQFQHEGVVRTAPFTVEVPQ